jgi:hypothetical protein
LPALDGTERRTRVADTMSYAMRAVAMMFIAILDLGS